MTWTYTNAPSTSARDYIRGRVGDTDTNDQLVSDEQIAQAIAEYPSNALLAASSVALMCAAIVNRRIDRSALGMSDSPSRSAIFYERLAERLQREGAQVTSAPSLLRSHVTNHPDGRVTFPAPFSIDDKQ